MQLKSKRILTLLLSLMFIFKLFAVSVFAETLELDTEVQSISQTTSSGTISDGMYLLESNYHGLTLEADGETAGSSLSQGSYYYGEEDPELYRLFKFTYLETVDGVDYYNIRPMTNNGLGITYSNESITLTTMSTDNTYSDTLISQSWAIVRYGDSIHIYNDSDGDNKYLTANEVATEGASIVISNTENEANSWCIYQITDTDYSYRDVKLTNYVGDLYSGNTYDFDYIAYSSSISQNNIIFSVTDVAGNPTTKATINASTGEFEAYSPGEVVVRAKFPTSLTIAAWHITIHATYYFSNPIPDTSNPNKMVSRYLCSFEGDTIRSSILNEAYNPRWEIIESDIQDYYIIKPQDEDGSTVLTSTAPALEGSAFLNDLRSDWVDKQLWYFEQLSDGSIKIQPKNYRETICTCTGTCECVKSCYLKTSSSGTSSDIIIGLADEYSKWYKSPTGTDVFMVGTSEPSYDHFTAFGNIMQDLDDLGYHSYNIVDISKLDVIGDTDILRMQSGMEQAKVIVTHTHGSYTNYYTRLNLSVSSSNFSHYFYPTDFSDLSNCDIAIFVGCYTAAEVPNPLPLAAVNAGADYAIGFKEDIVSAAASDWLTYFFDNYSNNLEYGIEKAATDAILTCYSFSADYNYNDINIDSMVVCSNQNNN